MAAEGFEAYHVPQQSRRDRLRGGVSDCTVFPSFYIDQSLLNPSDLLLLSHNKQKSLHFMDPQISSSSFQEINNTPPFLYNTQQSTFDVVYKQEQISSATHEPNITITHNNNNNNNSSNNYVSTGQGLSLSLSYQPHHQNQLIRTSTSNSTVPLELNLQKYDSSLFVAAAAAAYCNNELSSKSNSSTILGPFTGYASILKGSRFLKPAEQLMEQICDLGNINRGIYAEKFVEVDDVVVMDLSPDASDDDGSEHRRNKSNLVSMLDEVYKRYKQYYQQLQGVVASFESVPGLGNAAPFANQSIKALSKHFRCLKKAISDQMNYTIKSHSHSSQINCDDSTSTKFVGKDKLNHNNFQRATAIHNAGFVEHHQPVWRPQRGLPERAVTVLRAWLFDHFLHPYPTDSDKVMLAKRTGLSRNQVSNWFINARVRLWKPMVEEIHMLETTQAHKSASQRGQNNNNNVEVNFPTSNNSLPSDQNPSTSSAQQFQQVPSKRTRNNDPTDHMNLSYDNFSPRSRVGIDQVSVSSGGNGGVSLTLGLHHQNNNGTGIGGLSTDPFPRNAARRFGIDASNEGFMFGGGFEAPNRQFEGQLLHDFVG
ncbi:BEL1-like homeodomain protein 9 [Capsicum chacoense]